MAKLLQPAQDRRVARAPCQELNVAYVRRMHTVFLSSATLGLAKYSGGLRIWIGTLNTNPIARQQHIFGPPPTDKMATELTVQSERAFQKQPHSEFFLRDSCVRPQRAIGERAAALTTAA